MSYTTKFKSLALAATLGFGLLACSGGGGGSTTTSADPATGGTAVATVSGTGTQGAAGTAGLAVADKISVVSSTTSAKPTGKAAVKIATPAGATGWATTADYLTDPQFVYIQDRASDAFDKANEILCMVAQTNYDDALLVNTGAYKAQVDTKKCSNNRDSQSSGASSSSSSSGASADAPSYATWIVVSNRADATSPHVVSVWIHEKEMGPGGTPGIIFAKAVIETSAADLPPYGHFALNFVGYGLKADGTADTAKVAMKGYMRTVKKTDGSLALQFYNLMGDGTTTMEEKSTLYRNTAGTAGDGIVEFPDWQSCTSPKCTPTTTKKMGIAFNATNFLRTDLSATPATPASVCLDKAQLVSSVWRYGLYNAADGSQKTLSSGFPIKYTSDGTDGGTTGTDYYGYVGYWGIWLDNTVTIPNNAVVSKMSWNNGTAAAAAYTVMKSGGKLKKHTKNSTTLDKIKNVPLNYSMCTQSGQTFTCANYIAKWDGTMFAITQKMSNTGGGFTALTASDPTFIDVSALQWQSTLNMWSQSLGGQVMIKFPVNNATPTTACTKSGGWDGFSWSQETYNCGNATTGALTPPAASVPVVFYKEQVLMPGDADSVTAASTALKCFDGCPDGSKFTTTATGSAFYAQVQGMMTDTNYATSAKSYTYADAAYTLTDAANAGSVTLTTANTNLTNEWGGTLDWGAQTGPLFNPAAVVASTAATVADGTAGKTYAELLKCPWDPTAWGTGAQVCPWQAREQLPIYYTWETGWNNWNYLTALKGPNPATTVVPFDQPLDVTFTYPSTATGTNPAATDTKYAGVPFMLNYGGFGDLWGIPGQCVDPDTNTAVDCSAGANMRWVPEFAIPDGSLVTNGTGNYYVKGLEMEQRMAKVADASCSALTVPTYTLPDATNFKDPSDIGTEPTITDAPKVIGGVTQ
ncbi:MAG: hypothetical protein HZA03_11785 [Nitrospinae bacterium]|nr:hypothetical protein [Nitrospinota bacterium]